MGAAASALPADLGETGCMLKAQLYELAEIAR